MSSNVSVLRVFLNGVLNGSFTDEKLNDSDALMMMVKVCFIFQLIVILRINNSYSREDVFWRDCRQVSSMLPWNTESLSPGLFKDRLRKGKCTRFVQAFHWIKIPNLYYECRFSTNCGYGFLRLAHCLCIVNGTACPFASYLARSLFSGISAVLQGCRWPCFFPYSLYFFRRL